MPSWVEELPFAVAVAVLFAIVFARAQATYWLGRGAHAGARRTRFAEHLEHERVTRATEAIARWGWPVITVSFLTVGFQTVANATAGLIRMSWPRYTLAMIPGCLAWAFLYATAGFAVVNAWTKLAERAAWAPWAVLAVVLTAVITVVMWRRRRSTAVPAAAPGPAPEDVRAE